MIISGSASRRACRASASATTRTRSATAIICSPTKSDVFKELAEDYEDKTGIQIIAMTYYGMRHSTSNKPFKTAPA